MNLVIDIGNSRIKLALFNERDLMFNVPLDELNVAHLQLLLDEHADLKHAILSSVREYPKELKQFLQKSFKYFIELDASTPVPLINRYETPDTLGKDRLAAAVGATEIFPGKNVLVIDAGTAITYELVTANNEYLGGNISPGLNTRFKALSHFTGKLPLVESSDDFPMLGSNTPTAIQAGVQMGLLFEVQQYIEYFNTIYENLEIIITGGDAKFFDKKLKNSIFVNFNLTLIGLNRILEYNVKET
ncbi:type III pantothenate kinase [Sunxiuqinia elliptica]|uniref:Type III pantothenate kinase n=1 Tax=Sunxiuqinia elliptica TaxID=655355 RepID=A0A4V3BZ41_9BACT|nr:type III pantothenate kinase [Sunxiuqinia elliptica]TDO05049.1 type III pantothenate kinase [Sunxiuqinia elliptica]TDO64598.1 type III pantothenate kinase [Sunxiuqinia elliptica]